MIKRNSYLALIYLLSERFVSIKTHCSPSTYFSNTNIVIIRDEKLKNYSEMNKDCINKLLKKVSKTTLNNKSL